MHYQKSGALRKKVTHYKRLVPVIRKLVPETTYKNNCYLHPRRKPAGTGCVCGAHPEKKVKDVQNVCNVSDELSPKKDDSVNHSVSMSTCDFCVTCLVRKVVCKNKII